MTDPLLLMPLTKFWSDEARQAAKEARGQGATWVGKEDEHVRKHWSADRYDQVIKDQAHYITSLTPGSTMHGRAMEALGGIIREREERYPNVIHQELTKTWSPEAREAAAAARHKGAGMVPDIKKHGAVPVRNHIVKHFAGTVSRALFSNSNPYSNRREASATIPPGMSESLIQHLTGQGYKENSENLINGYRGFEGPGETRVRVGPDNGYGHSISVTGPKEAKYNPRPYYD